MKCTLSFVELTVVDWPSAVQWYSDVLGLTLQLRVNADRFALFSAGSARLALKAGQSSPAGVLLAFEVENLDQWEQQLLWQGVALDGPIKTSHEGYRRLKLRDPEGHVLTLFEWIRPLGE